MTITQVPEFDKAILGLGTLYNEYQDFTISVASRTAAAATFTTELTAATIIGDSVVVDAIASGDSQQLKTALEALGAEDRGVVGPTALVLLPSTRSPSYP